MNTRSLILSLCCLSLVSAEITQQQYYITDEIPTPEGVVMEASAIAILPEKKVAVATRRGEIWICEGAYGDHVADVKWKQYAHGLHEILGMFYKDGSIYTTSRQEITKLTDRDADGVADSFRTVNDEWGINGDYHEYNFGSDADPDGNIWVVHCLTGSSKSTSKWRGWAFRYNIDGSKAEPIASGIRSPGGIGFNPQGDCFYTDNQGLWNGSSSLKWLKPGSFQGNPTGNRHAESLGWQPQPNPTDNSTYQAEFEKDNRIQRPAVVIPHSIVGQSPTAIIYDHSNGAFGPFPNQQLIGEQTKSEVQRVFLEKVKGQYQGAVWHLLEGFRSGIVSSRMGEDGTLFVGGTNRGWGSKGGRPFTFERVRWTEKTPFEMHEMKVTNDGFVITFTEPFADQAAADINNYEANTWTYDYRSKYGSNPDVGLEKLSVIKAVILPDNQSVQITLNKTVRGNVHHLKLKNFSSNTGQSLWHQDVYYTLNELRD